MLAPAQLHHPTFVPGTASEVVAPEAFEGDNLAPSQRRERMSQRIVRLHGLPSAIEGEETRAARRTRGGLGVEPAVSGVVVLRAAGVAHRERRHGRAL